MKKPRLYEDHEMHTGKVLRTREECLRRYLNPRFFDRPSLRMTPAQLRESLREHINEISWILRGDMHFVTGNVAGRVYKRELINAINRLHDWRVSMTIIGGELGRPYLWEK